MNPAASEFVPGQWQVGAIIPCNAAYGPGFFAHGTSQGHVERWGMPVQDAARKQLRRAQKAAQAAEGAAQAAKAAKWNAQALVKAASRPAQSALAPRPLGLPPRADPKAPKKTVAAPRAARTSAAELTASAEDRVFGDVSYIS